MKYLKITNKGTVERELWELVGATDKNENDQSLIGFRGSGMKFAIVSAMRLGIEVIITSCDKNGPYTLRYFTKETPLGFKRILLDYNFGEEIKDTSFTTNALQDWDKPIGDDPVRSFKILREVITNAYDAAYGADKEFYIKKKAEKIEPPRDGCTSVYLEWREEYDKVFSNPARYFKFLARAEPIARVKIGHNRKVIFYPRSDERRARVFIQGVLVYCKEGVAAFDYSIEDKNLLSEERVVKDFAKLFESIYSAVDNTEQVEIIEKLLTILLARKGLETESIHGCAKEGSHNYGFKETSSNKQAVWRKAWIGHFGESAVLGSASSNAGREVNFFGYEVIDIEDFVISAFLLNKGVPSVSERYGILTKQEEVEWENLDAEKREIYRKAVEIFNNAYPKELVTTSEPIPVRFFTQKARTYDGAANRNPPMIQINVSALSEGLVRTLEVLVHEYRHIAINVLDDYDRQFVRSADKVIVKLLTELDAIKKKP